MKVKACDYIHLKAFHQSMKTRVRVDKKIVEYKHIIDLCNVIAAGGNCRNRYGLVTLFLETSTHIDPYSDKFCKNGKSRVR